MSQFKCYSKLRIRLTKDTSWCKNVSASWCRFGVQGLISHQGRINRPIVE